MEDIDSVNIGFNQNLDALPDDSYPVVISDIKKTTKNKFDFQTKKKLEELEDVFRFEFTVLEGEFQGRKLFQSVKPRLGSQPKPTNLYRIWCAVEDKKFENEDFFGFKPSMLINRNLKVVTENKQVGERTFTNIAAFQPLKTKSTSRGVDYDRKKDTVDSVNKAVDEGLDAIPF